MINEHLINGNVNSTFHDFVFSQSGMTITISSGTYHLAGVQQYSSTDGGTFTIPTPSLDTAYEVWLSSDGIHVYYGRTDQPLDIPYKQLIDKLAWFTVPSGATTLDDVQIDVVRMVEK